MRVSNFRPLPGESVTANPCGMMAFHQLRSCPKIGSPWKLAGVIYSLLRSSGRMLTSFVTRPQRFGRSPHPSFKTMRWPNGTHILAARTGAADKESLAVYMTSESRLSAQLLSSSKRSFSDGASLCDSAPLPRPIRRGPTLRSLRGASLLPFLVEVTCLRPRRRERPRSCPATLRLDWRWRLPAH